MNISRRDALMGATAAAVVTGAIIAPLATKATAVKAALGGVSPTLEPLLAMEQEWLAFRDFCDDWPDEEGEVYEALYGRLNEMAEALYRIPAKTLTGVAAKLRMWAWNCTGISDPHPYGKPWWRGDLAAMYADERGFAQVMRDLERLSGEVAL